MSTPQYTQAELQAIVNGMVHSKFAECESPQVVMNRAVRFVMGDQDIRSTKRSATLSPFLSAFQYDYTAPADLKGEKIIDIRKQVNRSPFERFSLVDTEEFDRKKAITRYRVAVRDENFSKILRIDGVEGNVQIMLNSLDSLIGNGTWALSGDATNLTLDTTEFVENAAFNFDTNSGGTTAILSTSNMTQVDLSTYDQQGAIFMWAYVPDSVDLTKLTNFILRWGNDSSNYWSKTITTNNEGQSFHLGWNLLRFDWSTATQTGTVASATIDYLHFTVTKSGTLAADTDWRIDQILFRVGKNYDTVYYSKYGWQTAAGVYAEESTGATDLLVADTDEIEMIAFKCAEFASQELKELDEVGYFQGQYENAKNKYQKRNPSEALKKSRNYGAKPRFNRRFQ